MAVMPWLPLPALLMTGQGPPAILTSAAAADQAFTMWTRLSIPSRAKRLKPMPRPQGLERPCSATSMFILEPSRRNRTSSSSRRPASSQRPSMSSPSSSSI